MLSPINAKLRMSIKLARACTQPKYAGLVFVNGGGGALTSYINGTGSLLNVPVVSVPICAHVGQGSRVNIHSAVDVDIWVTILNLWYN